MTIPTEDHWAQLSGADLVAELRKLARYPSTLGHRASLLRAAEVIDKPLVLNVAATARVRGRIEVDLTGVGWSVEVVRDHDEERCVLLRILTRVLGGRPDAIGETFEIRMGRDGLPLLAAALESAPEAEAAQPSPHGEVDELPMMVDLLLNSLDEDEDGE